MAGEGRLANKKNTLV